ncbi:ligase-associated DNA damage response endonuclease PdeM [Rhodobacteraceae bacterium LMO-12]|nr:ligase-associated DNA damage response endonuclease PdeM [Rhodobacteraceae bacterium LMO-JJ12]
MNGYRFTLSGVNLEARGSGALYWEARKLLCVSDLHLGKAERIARRGGASLPPYETHDTLSRLDAELAATRAETVVCLGDTFDDREAVSSLSEQEQLWIARLQAGRRWVWIAGNHDPGPLDIGGTHLAELPLHPLLFRHIAQDTQSGEISGHYHPKARLSTKGGSITRPCFLIDDDRVILPAFGTYTGGLHAHDAVLSNLMREEALAVLTGPFPAPIPMPR